MASICGFGGCSGCDCSSHVPSCPRVPGWSLPCPWEVAVTHLPRLRERPLGSFCCWLSSQSPSPCSESSTHGAFLLVWELCKDLRAGVESRQSRVCVPPAWALSSGSCVMPTQRSGSVSAGGRKAPSQHFSPALGRCHGAVSSSLWLGRGAVQQLGWKRAVVDGSCGTMGVWLCWCVPLGPEPCGARCFPPGLQQAVSTLTLPGLWERCWASLQRLWCYLTSLPPL